ncbi:hypothetical protein [Rhizobium ruizarguesonis]|uniref:hypothetical protein n=1 Tax=Rhizobium ruizarguesonis TaxID=2081791 RepID=UPI001FDF08E3|nr:hypothetical protein [Rhizobium ruizarguesonis]
MTNSRFGEIGRLRSDHACLPRAGTCEHESCILVDDDGKSLLRRQGPALDRIEEVRPTLELRGGEGRDAGGSRRLRIGYESSDNIHHFGCFFADGVRLQFRKQGGVKIPGVVQERINLAGRGIAGRM